MTALALLLLSAAPMRMAFELPQGWVVTDGDGKLLERVDAYAGLRPIDLALSPTSNDVAFTAKRETGLAGLYLWNGTAVRELSVSAGYHGFPTFSPDGKTVAFVHHPGAGSGPSGKHALGQNAQVWTVGTDGKNSAQRTTSHGCRASPHFASATKLVFTHTTCRGPQALEELTLAATPGEPKVLVPADDISAEPKLSPNRKALLYTQAFYADTRLVWAPLSAPAEGRVLATIPGRPRRVSANWSADGASVFFVKDGAVHRVALKTQTQVAVLSLAVEAP